MRALLLVCALAACGGSSKPPPETPDNTATTTTTTGEMTPTQVCERILALKDAGCELVREYDQDLAGCVAEYEQSRADAAQETDQLGHCFVDQSTCDAVMQCVSAMFAAEDMQPTGGAEQLPERACADHETYGAVYYPRAEWEQRRGATAVRFADVTSSLQEPIEVCNVEGELEWLTRVTCADGSNPFKGEWAAAHAARTGQAGNGGRCNAIIDHYAVPCPEKTYDVYMDLYVCPRD